MAADRRAGAAAEDIKAVKDAVGNILQDGDTVTVIKNLKVKGSSSSVKVGTRVKNIRLVEGDHDIDCKIDGFGAMQLKSVRQKSLIAPPVKYAIIGCKPMTSAHCNA